MDTHFAGKRILILGLAREGVSLARFLVATGASVSITDRASADTLRHQCAEVGNEAQFYLGGDHEELVEGVDVLYVSPGVPENNPVYQAARDRGTPVSGMTALFFALCPAPILAVTGSSGKTTTTGLIGHICRTAGLNTVVAGNIGAPMLDLLPQIDARSTVVLELSSFQLSLLESSPHIAVVTNISPNHLDRHGTMDAYVAAKQRIVREQTPADYVVLNHADALASSFAALTPAHVRWFDPSDGGVHGATVIDDKVVLRSGEEAIDVLPLSDIPLLGSHNIENVLAAVAATSILRIERDVMARAIRSFAPPPHRLQLVAERDGVRYIDDSIATSPARATVALQAIDAPIILIAGGRDKALPWEEFAKLIAGKVRVLLLIGEAAALIEQAVRRALQPDSVLKAEAIQQHPSLPAAVSAAQGEARPGEVVLLSPACASYDMFHDYEERAAVFLRAVEMLHAA